MRIVIYVQTDSKRNRIELEELQQQTWSYRLREGESYFSILLHYNLCILYQRVPSVNSYRLTLGGAIKAMVTSLFILFEDSFYLSQLLMMSEDNISFFMIVIVIFFLFI